MNKAPLVLFAVCIVTAGCKKETPTATATPGATEHQAQAVQAEVGDKTGANVQVNTASGNVEVKATGPNGEKVNISATADGKANVEATGADGKKATVTAAGGGSVKVKTADGVVSVTKGGVRAPGVKIDAKNLRLNVAAAAAAAAGNTQTCPSGNCKQSCAAGKRCTFTCAGGNCKQACGAGATCAMSCAGGDCTQSCGSGATCNLTCAGGDCMRRCSGKCTKTCAGGDCKG